MGRKRNVINDATLSSKVKFSESDIGKLNERFTVYTVSLMSYTQIANGFSFPKQVISKKAYQVDMLPVIGYYDGEDFEGHEDGRTVPYGAAIPNTKRFEEIDGEDYLVCDVAMWSSKYPEVKDLSKQNQSLELVGISGTYNSTDKVYNVSDFNFDSICILGENVKPAFAKARMDVDSNFSDEFEEFKKEFSLFLEDINNKQEKGEDKMGNENKQEDKISFTLSHETIHDQIFATMNPTDDEGYRSFNYCICEVKDNSFVALDCKTWENYYKFNYVIGEDGHVSVDMNTKTETFATFMTMDEMSALDKLKADGEKFAETKELLDKANEEFEKLSVKYTEIETEKNTMSNELETLRKFKEDKESEEKEAFEKQQKEEVEKTISEFASKLTNEEINEALGESRDGLIASEVESKLAVVFAKKELAKDAPKENKPKVFANISGNEHKIVTNTDRLVEEAKKLKK